MNVYPAQIILDVSVFRVFYFELETLLNKIVKLCRSFFRKMILKKNTECFIFIQKVNLFCNKPKSAIILSITNRVL